jgi:hypothetical protein
LIHENFLKQKQENVKQHQFFSSPSKDVQSWVLLIFQEIGVAEEKISVGRGSFREK